MASPHTSSPTADGRTIPIREHILRTIADLANTANSLDSDSALNAIERIARTENGAERQLATYNDTGDLRTVTAAIAAETAALLVGGV